MVSCSVKKLERLVCVVAVAGDPFCPGRAISCIRKNLSVIYRSDEYKLRSLVRSTWKTRAELFLLSFGDSLCTALQVCDNWTSRPAS